MKVYLADGSEEQIEGDSITGVELAKKLKKKLSQPTLALKINGTLKDLKTELCEGDRIDFVGFDDEEGRRIFWHSSAHILAQAVRRLYPDAKPAIGPPIENGFYYDFSDLEISENDFPKIEDEIKKIVNERLQPVRIEYASKEDALSEFKENRFKTELIENLEEGLSSYRQGDFVDLCVGPHIPQTGLVQAFKILKTSGAYWRGDTKNEQLTRIYAISFPEKKLLSEYLHMLEEAQKRDHRVIGRKLDLFSFHDEAPGMPFFHPRGMVIRDEILKFEKEQHEKEGYVEIKTPVMLSRELWETSGHWEHYRENMYTSQVEDRDFAIKPMNCPGCMLYYKSKQFSYRQLPLRVAEIGNVHRHEMSGALSGLFRVRSFHQDDAHIFMKPEDLKPEIRNVLRLSETIYAAFGLSYQMELSTRPEKSIGTNEQWELAERGLREALEEGGYLFKINAGDGAFYGPKIDMHIKDVLGRTWQCGTIQLDMSLPERFDLEYDGQGGGKERPIMIHRAIYGSTERFMGILIEHYGGKFPLWLSPVQARILTVADRHDDYANWLFAEFMKSSLRAEVDDSSESISKKVRNAQLDQVNYILVVGDREVEEKTVSVRTRGNIVLGAMAPKDLIEKMREEYIFRAADSMLKSTQS